MGDSSRRRLFLSICGLTAGIFAAFPADADFLDKRGGAKPIPAWEAFCQIYAGECDIDLNEPAVIAYDERLMAVLEEINLHVNRTIRPITDYAKWGVVDRWDFPVDGSGDCEDFQLEKRRLLVEAGVPKRAMPMTVVLDELNEGHAVLMVRTDRGDLILDNKRNEVLRWNETGYVYVKREGQDGSAWASLGGVSGVYQTARP